MSSTSDACPTRDSFSVADYLAGRLPESEAERFERHFFGCERCRELLEVAALARAALADEADPALPHAGRRRALPPWLSLALAASLLLVVAVASWRLVGPSRETFRGGEQGEITMAARGQMLTVHWAGVDGTDVYRVRLFDAAGELLVEEEVSAPLTSLELVDLESQPEARWVEVMALDALRQPLWRSSPRPVTRE